MIWNDRLRKNWMHIVVNTVHKSIEAHRPVIFAENVDLFIAYNVLFFRYIIVENLNKLHLPVDILIIRVQDYKETTVKLGKILALKSFILS